MQARHSCRALEEAGTNHADVAHHKQSQSLFKESVQATLDALLQEHADQPEFLKYFQNTGSQAGYALTFKPW